MPISQVAVLEALPSSGASAPCRWSWGSRHGTAPQRCCRCSGMLVLSSHTDTSLPRRTTQHDWWRACRVGEASHPGPAPVTLHRYFQLNPQQRVTAPKANRRQVKTVQGGDVCRIVVCNPTSVLHKEQDLLSLQGDILCVSETSAVARVQHIVGHKLRQYGLTSHWGAAVPSHQREGHADTLRGMAAGVAMFTHLPSRPSIQPLQGEHASCGRLAEAFVRFGPVEVRLLTLYGLPANHTGAMTYNNSLLQAAFDRACSCRIPCIIAGDFNCRPMSLPAGQAFASRGYHEAFQLHEDRTGQSLPPTCRGSTRHDTLLLHPVLVPFWIGAQVLAGRHLFDSHDPLVVTLKVPHALPTVQTWTMPKTWADSPPPPHLFKHHCEALLPQVHAQLQRCQTSTDVGTCLQSWASAVEEAVHRGLLDSPTDSGQCGLRKAQRGRCRPRSLCQRPVPQLVKAARRGDFTTDVEATSVLCRMRVRQVRRLEELARTIHAIQHRPGNNHRNRCACDQWRRIRNAAGYSMPFPAWLLRVAHFHQVPLDLPDADWLCDCISYTKFDCQALAKQEAKCRADKFKIRMALDRRYHASAEGFAAVRPAPHPPFTSVPHRLECQALLVHAEDASMCTYALPAGVSLHPSAPFTVNQATIPQATNEGDHICVRGPSLGESIWVSQDQVACTAPELAKAFSDYWGPLWGRDRTEESQRLAGWELFQANTQDLSGPLPRIDVDMCDIRLWRQAIRRMPKKKATGICGWSPSELKLLPDCALEVLIRIFQIAVKLGLPAHMLESRVCVLAKHEAPEHIKHSRPIVIFSTLYRLWGSVLVNQVLHTWGNTFPPAVMGSLPGRAASDLAGRQQHAIECALLQKETLYGVGVDIVKCLNQLPWPPLRVLMTRAGMPGDLVDFWLQGLRKVVRRPVFLGSVCPAGIKAYNGAPEGDPVSVAAMAAVCYWAHNFIQPSSAEFGTYVDNWSWQAPALPTLKHATSYLLRFLQSLKLPVDWTKSYSWATTPSGRQWLRTGLADVLPPEVQLPVARTVRELGAAFQFDASQHATVRKGKVELGLERLRKLEKVPRPILEKAQLIQKGVWPSCLYGLEGASLSVQDASRLRAAATRALLGPSQVASPHLALTCLHASLQDPHLFAIEKQVLQLRRFIHHAPHTAASMLAVMSDFHEVPRVTVGPATALLKSLHFLGLKMDLDARVKGPDNVCLQLQTASAKDVRSFLTSAWECHVERTVAHRNGLQGVGTPWGQETARILRQVGDAEALVLARYVCGAYSSGAAKHKWEPAVPDMCPLCGAKDTKEHRLLTCSALEHVYKDWAGLMQYCLDRWPHWLHGLYAVRAEGALVTNLIFAQRRMPAASNKAAQELARHIPRLLLFTDGSCRHPTVPVASHSGFAVVMALTTDVELVLEEFERWRATGCHSNLFCVVCQGLTPGSQGINKAEAYAILQACRFAAQCPHDDVEIVSDSKVALRNARVVVQGALGSFPELAKEMQACWRPHLKLTKVASHQDMTCLAGRDLLMALGNDYADTAAKEAVKADLSIVTEIVDQVFEFTTTQRDCMLVAARYMLAVSAEASRLLRAKGDTAVSLEPVLRKNLDEATSPAEAWRELDPKPGYLWTTKTLQNDWLVACPWPPWFTFPLWQWLRRLRWELPGAHKGVCNGVTNVELLVHFVASTGVCPPARDPRPEHAGEYLDARHTDMPMLVPLREWTAAILTAARSLETVSGCRLLPDRRRKVYSLRTAGVQAPRHGLQQRPVLGQLDGVWDLLREVLHDGGVSPLLASCTEYTGPVFTPPQEVCSEHHSLSTQERQRLFRWLRRLRH